MTYTLPKWIRSMWRDIVARYGWDVLLEMLQEAFPQQELYTVSRDWLTREGSGTTKAKGAKGDVLIYWGE